MHRPPRDRWPRMKVVWYFDFISPFAYLQYVQLRRTAELTVQPCPVLFAGLLKHWRHKGPAEIPAKRSMTYQYCHWLAQQYAVEFKAPPSHPFNPLAALRFAIAGNSAPDVIEAIFSAIWRRGLDINHKQTWAWIAERTGHTDIQAMIAQPEVKQALHTNTDTAIAAGVFGVPTLSLDGRLFWGLDMTDMALSYLRHPQHFDDAEYRRLANLSAA